MARKNVKRGAGEVLPRLTIELTQEQDSRLEQRCSSSGISKKFFIQQAITRDLNYAVMPKYHPANGKWHDALETILNGDSRDTARTIRNVLNAFLKAPELEQPKPKASGQ